MADWLTAKSWELFLSVTQSPTSLWTSYEFCPVCSLFGHLNYARIFQLSQFSTEHSCLIQICEWIKQWFSMVLRNVIRNKYFSVACEQYIWIVIGFRHSPIPPPQLNLIRKEQHFTDPASFLLPSGLKRKSRNISRWQGLKTVLLVLGCLLPLWIFSFIYPTEYKDLPGIVFDSSARIFLFVSCKFHLQKY